MACCTDTPEFATLDRVPGPRRDTLSSIARHTLAQIVTSQTQSRRIPRAASNYLEALWSRREFAWYMAMGNLRSRNG